MTELLFSALRRANLERLPLFKNSQGGPAHSQPDGSDWALSAWCNATLGELGELANLIKKIERGDITLDLVRTQVADELADVVTYLDILAFRCGVDLGTATIDKWNRVSKRVGVVTRLLDADALLAISERRAQRAEAAEHLRNEEVRRIASTKADMFWLGPDREWSRNSIEEFFGEGEADAGEIVVFERAQSLPKVFAFQSSVNWEDDEAPIHIFDTREEAEAALAEDRKLAREADEQPSEESALEPVPFREIAPYYILTKAGAEAGHGTVFVKEGNFFREQGGLREEWGATWNAVRASSIREARDIGYNMLGVPAERRIYE